MFEINEYIHIPGFFLLYVIRCLRNSEANNPLYCVGNM